MIICVFHINLISYSVLGYSVATKNSKMSVAFKSKSVSLSQPVCLLHIVQNNRIVCY